MLIYLKEFEDLKIVQSLQELDKCEKHGLVKSIWLTHRKDLAVRFLKVVKLIMFLHRDYV